MADSSAHKAQPQTLSHQPGVASMPPWTVGELPEAPRLTLRSWAMLLGPGLIMGGASIGGGEWLAGPLTTARYGGAILWLATVSIVAQVIYNLEISRYTLYTGEPIFNGKFRLLPGPVFWMFIYLFLDFGSVFPYLAGAAATPLAAVMLGEIPKVDRSYTLLGHTVTGLALLQVLKYVVFIGMMAPLVIGGKVLNSLKAVIGFKVVFVLGFLLFLAVMYSSAETWREIITGFFKFGSVPVLEPTSQSVLGMDNVFVSLWQGRGLPNIDWHLIGELGALAAISGSGGLTNTAISAYTRDQGWGMGKLVGAVPSIFGGRELKLAHTGKVFPISRQSVAGFRRWYHVVLRDQLVVWGPACFVGIALPCMLSVQFLPRNTVADEWVVAGMTADGVRDAVGPARGQLYWLLVLFCGFLVLAPNVTTTADGVIRRWVDVCWTAIPRLRTWDPRRIRGLYFGALCCYAAFGLVSLTFWDPVKLLKWAGNFYNAALGFSCWHVLAVNCILLPRELRPNWGLRAGLVIGGLFFTALSIVSTMKMLGKI
jgi:hypothetical protein